MPMARILKDDTSTIFRHKQSITSTKLNKNISLTWDFRVKRQKGFVGLHARIFEVEGMTSFGKQFEVVKISFI